MSQPSATRSRTTRTRIFALLAGGLVIGVGATATLATWSDNEWVFGGATGNNPGLGTSSFEVQQNRGAGWQDIETAPGGILTFTGTPLALSPGETVYTQVSLQTTAGTTDAGTLALLNAIPAPAPVPTSDPALWNALDLRVVVTPTLGTAPAPTCGATTFTSGTPDFVLGAAGTPSDFDTDGTGTEALLAASANTFHYCFEITLPTGSSDTLQGLRVAPAWQFHAESV